MSSETTLYALLAADPAVTTKVGAGAAARIYPDIVPQDIKGPAIAYSRLSTEPVTTIHTAVPVATFATLEVSCTAASRVEAEALASAALSALGGGGFVLLDRRAELDDATDIWAAVLTVRHFST